MFKVGDRVKCIEDSGSPLKVGQEYTVTSVTTIPQEDQGLAECEQMVRVRCPGGPLSLSQAEWYSSRFTLAAAPSEAPPDGRALTYDGGKEPLAMLPWAGIDEVARVQAYGHKKYKDFNNYRKGMEVSRNLSCAIRHIRDYMNGHDADAESGCNPLGHAACRILFVLQNLHDGTAIDDRYKGQHEKQDAA